ncbi:MAG: TetR/AcrR family transcriptional regulator [Desulfobacterales bacterium]|nr:TetR/AcrR family transcriptional regulator [Desulfobacterales bacterium]
MPKIVDHDKYRNELLEKCMNLFIGKGYANISMREIAGEIGVSTGTLYHYFPTKRAILEKLFAYVSETNIGEYLDRIKSCETVEEKIDVIIAFLLENEEYYKNVLLLAVDLYRHPESDDATSVFTAFTDDYRNVFARELEMPDEIANTFFIHLLGLVFHRILTPQKISYQKQVALIRDLMAGFLIEKKGGVETTVESQRLTNNI